MKSLTASKRNLRTVLTDLIIYGNLAFTFVFFSAAFDRGCSNSSTRERSNEIVSAQKAIPSTLLAEKGQTKAAVKATAQK
jgi:hypothetical protein